VDKTIVIWGAGRIGRGFVADLFNAADYHIVLVDQSSTLIAELRDAGSYTVVRAPSADQLEETTIQGYTALSTAQREEVATAVVRADVLALAVYPKHFGAVAGDLAPCLLRRREERPDAPLDILLCTNLVHAGPQFQALLEEALPAEALDYLRSCVGVVETLVIRIVPDPPADALRDDPLLVWTNGYPELPVDRHAFKGAVPQVSSLRFVDDMRAEELRKMYTYNMTHAVLAYHGAQRGHELIVDCMADPKVRAEAEGALDEASRALQAAYGLTSREMSAWIEGVLAQTDNPALGDTVKRYAADTRRKLRRDDRLVGPAVLARKHGVEPRYLVRGIAAALRYADADDAGTRYVEQRISTLSLREAMREICGLTAADQDLVEAIIRAYRRLPLEVEWAERAQRAYQLGFEYERLYHGCGQCTLAAVLEALGQFDETLFDATTTLSGGLGLCGDASCAALTAGALAIGMAYPRTRANFGGDRESKYRSFSMMQRLRERYLQRYGTITCHDIHRHEMGRPFDLRYPDEREAFEEAGAHQDKCTSVVARAAKWVVEIIGEEMIEDQLNRMDTSGKTVPSGALVGVK